jgi:aspartyl-tRNA(Asn)/glutamyl-tRNA(Gln) amidotransferase subunit C
MSEVNEALIRKVADLARLELNDAEISDYVKSIGDILKHVSQLDEANVEGIEPMYYGVDDDLRFREDKVVEFGLSSDGAPKILACAPDVQDNGFKVPQIVGS